MKPSTDEEWDTYLKYVEHDLLFRHGEIQRGKMLLKQPFTTECFIIENNQRKHLSLTWKIADYYTIDELKLPQYTQNGLQTILDYCANRNKGQNFLMVPVPNRTNPKCIYILQEYTSR